MYDVKEICEQLLAQPEPPATAPADLLRLARQTQRRMRVTTVSGLLVLTVTAAAITIPFALRDNAPAPQSNPSPSASVSTPPPLLSRDPRLARMQVALEQFTPPGLTILDRFTQRSADGKTDSETMLGVSVTLTTPSLAGLLPAEQVKGTLDVRRFLEPRDPAFLRNPCRTDRMRELGAGPPADCDFSGGIAVGTFQRSPGTRFAIRHVGEWTILVLHNGAVITDDQMRQIVLDPAFEP